MGLTKFFRDMFRDDSIRPGDTIEYLYQSRKIKKGIVLKVRSSDYIGKGKEHIVNPDKKNGYDDEVDMVYGKDIIRKVEENKNGVQ